MKKKRDNEESDAREYEESATTTANMAGYALPLSAPLGSPPLPQPLTTLKRLHQALARNTRRLSYKPHKRR